jgi:CheY-like chemotaxis protein
MAECVRVVLVDDVIEVRRLLRSTLRFSGEGRFAVVGDAATAAEAIALTERLQPQIVVLDLGLPDLSGHSLVASIREAAPYAKIVVFTGSNPDDEEWFAQRTSGHVLKDQLATLVDTLVAISEPSASASSFLALPRDPASLAIAREHVRRQLHAWALPSLVDAVVLVVSELAGNAVEHARSGFGLRLELRNARVLRVEVVDHGPGSPELQRQDTASERGRGLLVVSQLSSSWGIEAIEGNGKTVWAELRTGDPA